MAHSNGGFSFGVADLMIRAPSPLGAAEAAMNTIRRTLTWGLACLLCTSVTQAAAQQPAAQVAASQAASIAAGPSDECKKQKSPSPVKQPSPRPQQEPVPGNINVCAPVISVAAPASAVPYSLNVPMVVMPPPPIASGAGRSGVKDESPEAKKREQDEQTEFTFKIKDLVEGGFKSKDKTIVYVTVGTFLFLLCLFVGTYLFKKFVADEPEPSVGFGTVVVWIAIAAGIVIACWYFWPGDAGQKAMLAEIEIATQRRVIEATEARSTAAVTAAVDAHLANLRADILLQNSQFLAQRSYVDRSSDPGACAPNGTLLLFIVGGVVAGAALVVLALVSAQLGGSRRFAAFSSDSPTPTESSAATRRGSRLLAAIFEAQDQAAVFIGELQRALATASDGVGPIGIHAAPLLAALGAVRWHLEVDDDLRYSSKVVAADADASFKAKAEEWETVKRGVEALVELLGRREVTSDGWKRHASDEIWRLRRMLLAMNNA